MEGKLKKKLAILRGIVEDGADTLAIDGALAPIAEAQDPSTIAPLLLLLRDVQDDHGMWSILHAAEQFDDKTYLSSFLSVLPDVEAVAPKWASILVMRVLNSDTYRLELARQLRDADAAVRRSTKQICERINSVDPQFLAKTTVVLVAAG